MYSVKFILNCSWVVNESVSTKMASYSQIMSELLRRMNWKWLTRTLSWYI